MAMYKLRYYLSETEYNHTKNENVLRLLKAIKEKHEVDYEIFPLRLNVSLNGGSYTDESHAKEIYEKHFRPMAKVLSQRTGTSLPRGLRSRQGRGSYYIAGILAILEDSEIGWYTCWESTSEFKEYDEDSEIGFLKALLENGSGLLNKLCPKVKSPPHEILIDKFIQSRTIEGNFEREVKVGQMLFESEQATFDWRKTIDVVCHTDEGTWVFEAKPKLNWEAFGQVIAYSYLYEKERKQKVFRGIICDKTELEILHVCRRFNITVLVRDGNKFDRMGA